MSTDTRYIVMIVPDNDFDVKGFSDIPSLVEETTAKLDSGDLRGMAKDQIGQYAEDKHRV